MSSTPPLVAAIIRSMHHATARQSVIASNIANGETPHFKARDVQPTDFSDLLSRQVTGSRGIAHITRPQVVSSATMTALGASALRGRDIVEDRDTGETKPDGNNVSLEEQVLKMGEVRADFSTLTNLYRKQMGLLNTALGRGG